MEILAAQKEVGKRSLPAVITLARRTRRNKIAAGHLRTLTMFVHREAETALIYVVGVGRGGKFRANVGCAVLLSS